MAFNPGDPVEVRMLSGTWVEGVVRDVLRGGYVVEVGGGRFVFGAARVRAKR